MRYSILTLSIACATENQIIHDGECDAVPSASEPVVYVNQCPEVNLSCPDIPECPDVNVTCPEPEVVVELISPEPNINVNVEAPNVTVTNNVEAPDFTDLIDAIQDFTATGSSYNNVQWAHIGRHSNPNNNVWINNTSDYAILTSAATNHGGCDIYSAAGALEHNDICDSSMCSRSSWSPGTQGSFTFTIEPGGWVDCYASTSAGFFLGGYYQ